MYVHRYIYPYVLKHERSIVSQYIVTLKALPISTIEPTNMNDPSEQGLTLLATSKPTTDRLTDNEVMILFDSGRQTSSTRLFIFNWNVKIGYLV